MLAAIVTVSYYRLSTFIPRGYRAGALPTVKEEQKSPESTGLSGRKYHEVAGCLLFYQSASNTALGSRYVYQIDPSVQIGIQVEGMRG